MDKITLYYCKKHNEWWSSNCSNCMVDDNEAGIRADERDKAAYGKEQIKLADKHYHDLKIEFDDRIEKARADERTKVAYMIADKCDCRKKPETVLDEILDWTEGIIKKEVVALKRGEMPE